MRSDRPSAGAGQRDVNHQPREPRHHSASEPALAICSGAHGVVMTAVESGKANNSPLCLYNRGLVV